MKGMGVCMDVDAMCVKAGDGEYQQYVCRRERTYLGHHFLIFLFFSAPLPLSLTWEISNVSHTL